MQRLCAVVAHAHGHALRVEVLADVVGVDALDLERHGPDPVLGLAEDADPRDLPDPVHQQATEFALMLEHLVKAHLLEVADGRREGRNLGHGLGAGLEALRGGHELGGVHRHRRDHRPAGEHGRQRIEQLRPAPEHAESGGPERLVRGERREVDVEVDEVHGHVRHGLAGVEDDEGADLPGPGDEGVDGVDRPEHVRDVGEGEHLRRLVDDLVEPGQVELTGVGDRDPAQLRPGRLGELLPGHEVGVVLHLGDDDRVACAEGEALRRLPAEAAAGPVHAECDDVERLGGVLRPHDLVRFAADESGDGCASGFERVGGHDRERMRAPVHGCVALREELRERVDDAFGLLRGRPGVEIGQRGLPDPGVEDREVTAQPGEHQTAEDRKRS